MNKIARAATLLLHRSVRDAVFSVFNHAAETVRALFMDFVPNRVALNEVCRCVDRLLPELLAKSGDPSARIHTLAQHTILCIASCPEVLMQHLIGPAMSRTVGSGTHPRLALSRLQMLEQLVLSQGISTDKQSGLTCRSLSECGGSGIHHPAEPVRKVAERILLLVYTINPRLVRKQLPPDDDITRRNLLYRQLFAEFDRIDRERRRELLDSNRRNDNSQSDSRASPVLSPNTDVAVRNKSVPNEIRFGIKNGSPADGGSPIKCVLKSKSGPEMTDESIAKKSTSNMRPGTHLNVQSRESSNSTSVDDSSSGSELRCSFCNWTYNGNEPDQLDKHYWKACPILTKCPQCTHVIEVVTLNAHLLGE